MDKFLFRPSRRQQTYGFPHQYSKTMLPAVFWLFFDVQKVKKIDPTHTAYVQDARRRGVYGSNMVVVAKKVKSHLLVKKSKKNFFLAINPSQPFFQKTPNFSKSKHRRALGPTFLDSPHHFTSNTPFADEKKIVF